jgi:hypothetical protein
MAQEVAFDPGALCGLGCGRDEVGDVVGPAATGDRLPVAEPHRPVGEPVGVPDV